MTSTFEVCKVMRSESRLVNRGDFLVVDTTAGRVCGSGWYDWLAAGSLNLAPPLPLDWEFWRAGRDVISTHELE